MKCPESIEELKELEQMLPLCREGLYKDAQARIKVGAAKSVSEASRQIGKELDRKPEVIRSAIQREKKSQTVAMLQKKIQFNRTNSKIDWAWWSWNPVIGCKHGCEYCYARDISMRFNGHFEPTFFPERLTAPVNTKLPNNGNLAARCVFVCSMADLFGGWVPQEWIDKVLDKVRKHLQWNFLFLTKNPQRLIAIDWPKNAWVGATADTQSRLEITEEIFNKIKAPVKFISCEPILEPLHFNNLKIFDWIIMGGMSPNTGVPEGFQPEWSWVESLINQARRVGIKIYCKPNLEIKIREYPQ